MIGNKNMVIAAGVALLIAAAYLWKRGAVGVGQDVASAVTGAAAGVVIGAGQAVGVPATNADTARALMDQFDAAPWYQQLTLSFQISAYASAADYVKWTTDHTYRPAPGAY